MPGLLTEQEIDELPIEGDYLDGSDLEPGDGPQIVLPDGCDQELLMAALNADLRRGEHAKAILAEAEMRRVIELSQAIDHRSIEGLGQVAARIPLSVYLHWTARYGPDFWRHRDSLDFIEKRADGGRGNPGFRIKTAGKCTIIVDKPAAKLPADQLPPDFHRDDGTAGAEQSAPAATSCQPSAPPRSSRGGRWRN